MEEKINPVREFFSLPVFNGNASLSDDMRSFSIDYVEDSDLSAKLVADALWAIIENKQELVDNLPKGEATSFTISGWNVDGLNESNLMLLTEDSVIYDGQGASIEFRDGVSEGLIGVTELDPQVNSMTIIQSGFTLCLTEKLWKDSFVVDGAFNYDAFVQDPLIVNFTKPLSFSLERFDRILASLKKELPYKIKSNDSSVSTLYVEMSLDAFQIARWGRDELYYMVEQKFGENGVGIEIQDMELKPVRIDGNDVVYECFPSEFKITNKESPLFLRGEEEIFSKQEESDIASSIKPV